MKILMVAYANYSTDARIKSYVASLEKNGHNCEIWALKEKNYHTKNLKQFIWKYQGNGPVLYMLSYFQFYLYTFFYSFNKIGKYDIIHYHNMPNFIIFSFFLHKMWGTKIILDNHDLMPITFKVKFALGDNHWISKLLLLEQRFSAKFADFVITADHNQKDYLIRNGIAPYKIDTILNIPYPGLLSKITQKNSDKEFCLVYHGTIAKRLGLDIAIRAVQKVYKQIPEIKFYIVGDGDHLEYISELIEDLHLTKYVYLSRKFVAVEELSEILSKMQVGIVPNRKNLSTDNYMLPVKLLEYVYLGIPVIAADLNVIRRYFSNNMVLYFESENVDALARSILKLYHEPVLRKKLAKDAHQFYKKYNWNFQEQQYNKILECVLTVNKKNDFEITSS